MHSRNFDLALGAGVTTLGMGLLAPVLPLYAQSLGASPALVGLFLASFGFTRLFIALPAGWLANLLGYRFVLIISLFFIALASLLCAISGNFWSLALFCMIEGAAATVYATAGTAALVIEVDKENGRSLAVYQAAGALGIAVGPGLSGLIVQLFGPRGPFFVYAVLAALAAWWLHRKLELPGFLNHQPFLVSSAKKKLAGEADQIQSQTCSTKKILLSPLLLPLWLVGFAFVFLRLGVQTLVGPFLGTARLGLSSFEIGLALSLSGLIGVACFYPAGWLVDHFSPRLLIIGSGLVMLLALGLLETASNYLLYLLALLLLAFGNSLSGPAPVALLAGVVPKTHRATAIGIYRTFGDAGSALAPLVLGGIINWAGYSGAIFNLAGLILTAIGNYTWFSLWNKSQPQSQIQSVPRQPRWK